jgi:predicted secreted Zn-dependent protease
MASIKSRLNFRRCRTGLRQEALLLLGCIILPAQTQAEPEISISKIYYTIEGNSADAILADIHRKTPVKHNGKQHSARTDWHVSWQFWWYGNGNSCEISKVTTRLDVVYTLPRLKISSSMPEELLARWETFDTALFSHEQGHKDLGVRAANEIENRITAMGARDSCSRLEGDANRIARDVIEEYGRLEKEYDRTTNHGINTGAFFHSDSYSEP